MSSPFEWFVVLSLVLCASLLVAVLMRTSSRRREEERDSEEIVVKESALTLFSDLSFRDALNFQRARNHVESGLLSKINKGLQGAGDGAIIGIEILNLAASRDLLLAKFPDHANSLLRSGKAVLLKTKHGGETLLEATQNGKVLAHARKVDPSTIQRLAAVGPMVVGAAHLIAGYDNAQKLKKISEKLDIVISARFRDMVAELESIYESIKECAVPNATLDRTHLLHLRLRLKHLRCAWVAQVQSALSDMKNPESRSFLDKWMFSRNKPTAKKLRDALLEQEQPLYLVRFAISLEQMIAEASGDHVGFEAVTLADVRDQIEQTRSLIRERSKWIQKLGPKMAKEVQQIGSSFDALEESLGADERESKAATKAG